MIIDTYLLWWWDKACEAVPPIQDGIVNLIGLAYISLPIVAVVVPVGYLLLCLLHGGRKMLGSTRGHNYRRP